MNDEKDAREMWYNNRYYLDASFLSGYHLKYQSKKKLKEECML
jgi:hypothetical protein